ncbi:uncharacterized protein LOC128961398 [Oppia nitens]|uniref:uncharacterized protein LOC128961398 n=1 Tax=Oppia nitens TaxID=1686743 RepID=UPI0023DBBB3F|nr:uncharacterized protein LOC128961398 [Oppia nitens]
MIYNQMNKSHKFFDFRNMNYEECDDCSVPTFIEDLKNMNNSDMIINGMTDFNDIRQYLLVFNVSGKPKFCTIDGKQQLNTSCSESNLQSIASHCFDSNEDNTTTTPDNTNIILALSLILMIVIIFGVIIITIISLYIYNRWFKTPKPQEKNLKRIESTSNSNMIGRIDSNLQWNMKVSSMTTSDPNSISSQPKTTKSSVPELKRRSTSV